MNKEFEQYIAKKNLDYLNEYLNLIHSKVERNAEEFKAHEDTVFQKYLDDGGDPEFYEDDGSSEDIALEQYDSQQLMYKSFIVSVFMFFMEHLTNSICDAIKTDTKQLFSYKEIAGTGIGRSINYLTKVLGAYPIQNINTKTEFEIARIVRNAIVHADGALNTDDENRIEKYIASTATEIRLGYHDLHITQKYTESLLQLAKKYTDELLSLFD